MRSRLRAVVALLCAGALTACPAQPPKKKRARPAKTKSQGVSLKPVKGALVKITDLSARTTQSLLDGVDDVRFPGAVVDAQNALQVRFDVVARKRLPADTKLTVRYVCQFGTNVIADEREQPVQLPGAEAFVSIAELSKGKRGTGYATSRPQPPELGNASACEATFTVAGVELGKVCATGGNGLALRACSADEIKRVAVAGGAALSVSEPVARVAHEGAAGWYLITTSQSLPGEHHAVTRVVCRDGTNSETRTFDHVDTPLQHLAAGESAVLSFGMSKLKWLTRESGTCEVVIGASPSPSVLATFCVRGGRTSTGACSR